jgi:putative FmdB family regulatory protein
MMACPAVLLPYNRILSASKCYCYYLNESAILSKEGDIMPIYEYICSKCDNRFSLLRTIFESDKEALCPRCDSTEVKKVISSFACSTGNGSPVHPFGSGG